MSKVVSRFFICCCLALAAPLTAFAQGATAQVQVLRDGQERADGLVGAQATAISPDGKHVYVGSGGDNAIGIYARDAQSGRVSFVDVLDAKHGSNDTRGIACLTVSPDGKNVYALSLHDNRAIVFSRDAGSGRLRAVQQIQNGDGGVAGLIGPASVLVSRDGAFVYVAAYIGDALFTFQRDSATGKLTLIDTQRGADLGLGAPIALAESPERSQLLVLSSRDFTLTVFNRDARTGKATVLDIQREGVNRVRGLGAARALSISPDGRHVYVVGAEGTLAIFRRDPTTRKLSFVDSLHDARRGIDGLSGANGVVTSPDGKLVYIAAGGDSVVTVFQRDDETGLLSHAELIHGDGLAGARCISMTADGRHLYVAAARDNALAVFRNTSPGAGR